MRKIHNFILLALSMPVLLMASCQEPLPEVFSVVNVTLDKTSVTLTEGDVTTLTATVSPSNATNKNVIWSSSDNTVATVSNGKVTAVKAGTATITVKTEDGNKTATCTVTVNARTYPVESVTLDKTSVTLTEGDVTTLTATVTPSNATNKNVIWSSSDNTVATVSDGKVTAVKAGTATITVKTKDGNKSATCTVTVIKKGGDKVKTEKDEGSLNYGSNGSAGDNIDEENDVFDGGSL